MRENLRKNLRRNPEATRRVVLSLVGAKLASRGVPLEVADDVSASDAEALAEGYISRSVAEIATKPPWYTDIPLLGRIIKATRHLRKRKGS